ncbi:MAG: peroxiredoxin family protein, partial [Arenimonas sp.]
LKSVRNMLMANELPFTLPVGEKVPVIDCKLLATGETVTVSGTGQAIVLVFLSSTCPKCREKLPEMERLLPLLQVAGVNMWLVSQESKWRLKHFLKETSLSAIATRVHKHDYKVLNPTQTSPYYLFIDHTGCLEAGGLIGDDNWLSFCAQMDEMEIAVGAAA